jgi:NAD(P)-dependent dehydrogenase (short-subunit alcohol dehydrogenase family)
MLQPETMAGDYSPASDLLSGRTILITGAGGGLGRALAIACGRHGATGILLGKTTKKLEATYDAVVAAGGPQPAIYPMNLVGATWNDHQQLADVVDKEIGKLHGIAHCAAHFTSFAPLETMPPRDWMDSLQVNLTAAFTLTRVCLPLLAKADDASVAFITESAAFDPKPYRGAYGITKYALAGLAAMWAQELTAQPQIRINAFDPGPMRTDLRRKGYPEGLDKVPGPEAAAQSLLWLLGPDSRGQTGKAFRHKG